MGDDVYIAQTYSSDPAVVASSTAVHVTPTRKPQAHCNMNAATNATKTTPDEDDAEMGPVCTECVRAHFEDPAYLPVQSLQNKQPRAAGTTSDPKPISQERNKGFHSGEVSITTSFLQCIYSPKS